MSDVKKSVVLPKELADFAEERIKEQEKRSFKKVAFNDFVIDLIGAAYREHQAKKMQKKAA